MKTLIIFSALIILFIVSAPSVSATCSCSPKPNFEPWASLVTKYFFSKNKKFYNLKISAPQLAMILILAHNKVHFVNGPHQYQHQHAIVL